MTSKPRSASEQLAAKLWTHRGQARPDFARPPGPNEESVWDYPRPPALMPDSRKIEVEVDGRIVAESRKTIRVLETASPPTFYIPPEDVASDLLQANSSRSHCEWKGFATYWDFVDAATSIASVGWSYPQPTPEFDAVAGWFSFYPAKAICRVDGHLVRAQEGGFYGGWVTPEVVGPFKGEPGTGGW